MQYQVSCGGSGTSNVDGGQPIGRFVCLGASKIFEAFLRNLGKIKSSFFLEACTARGAAQTRTIGSLICFSESSLQLCQVLSIDISLLEKRELWNVKFVKKIEICQKVSMVWSELTPLPSGINRRNKYYR